MSKQVLQQVKQRFSIIGVSHELERAIDTALQVAPTDLSVLITGESGVGKENFPQIIHLYSKRKHGPYFAVNCGSIPEGTIDSELFGHEKGAFTGAVETRKGYFEVADEGTLFLDEVAELPLSTQVRLLRVLQTGEFIKVGSSKVEKTDVRVVAATNKNLMRAIEAGKFREDLYYRLNTVPITIPSLRERKDDIYLLFRKFAVDFAERYKMPSIKLTDPARVMLESYRWPGNIRQLKSLAEQISVIEHNREIGPEDLVRYLPAAGPEYLPVKTSESQGSEYLTDRDIIFKILYQLRHEVEELKKRLETKHQVEPVSPVLDINKNFSKSDAIVDYEEDVVLSIQNVNAELIKKALEKHGGKRKLAAAELGISERTLYRKIKELNLDL